MNKIFTALLLVLSFVHGKTQNVYDQVPVIHDTVFQWTAESDKVINLGNSSISLKAWYLDKLKKGPVNTYSKKRGSNYISSGTVSMPDLYTPQWLKGLGLEVSTLGSRVDWLYVDKSRQDYDRYKYRGGILTFNRDPCCSCDSADAFRAKQILNYKNGKFYIWNVFISPLCARQTNSAPFEWYPLADVAYNNSPERQFPGAGKDVLLLNTNEIDYDFDQPSQYDTVLSTSGSDIGSLVYQDLLKGKLNAYDIETGEQIPAKDFLVRKMPADTVVVMDPDTEGRVLAFKVLQQERSPREFGRLRVKQDLYFDFKNERLYSVIRSVKLLQVHRLPSGMIRGISVFCRIE